MICGSIRGADLVSNNIFDLTDPGNRDDCFVPFAMLKTDFRARGIDVQTADRYGSRIPDFEIHLNAGPIRYSCPTYLLMMESAVIYPANRSSDGYRKYRKVFTWDDTLVDNRKFFKLNFPNIIGVPAVDGWRDRDQFCCVIAGNKSIREADPRELYSARVDAIRWFETNAPDEFNLYGQGWEFPPMGPGRRGRVIHRLRRFLPSVDGRRPFPSYRGKVERKTDVLRRHRFAICYENVRDLPGYVTEKIFDCFFSGCVPVYWGASNIDRYVPGECYIDRRGFCNTAEVYRFLKDITEAEYRTYQQAIAEYLDSQAVYAYSANAFVETIVSGITDDLASAR